MKIQYSVAFMVACICAPYLAAMPSPAAAPDLAIYDGGRHEQTIDAAIRGLSDKRAVFIGEEHERYDQHLDQLEIIRRLHIQAPARWVIGVEYIQRKFQPVLDAYIA